jgi:hypothetical protein
MQRLEVLRLDFPSAVQLVDQQSGIEAHVQVFNPVRAGGLEASDESSILRYVVVPHRPYWLRNLLERGLQDHTNRGLTLRFTGLLGDYASVGREQVVAGLGGRAVAGGRPTFPHGAKAIAQLPLPRDLSTLPDAESPLPWTTCERQLPPHQLTQRCWSCRRAAATSRLTIGAGKGAHQSNLQFESRWERRVAYTSGYVPCGSPAGTSGPGLLLAVRSAPGLRRDRTGSNRLRTRNRLRLRTACRCASAGRLRAHHLELTPGPPGRPPKRRPRS